MNGSASTTNQSKIIMRTVINANAQFRALKNRYGIADGVYSDKVMNALIRWEKRISRENERQCEIPNYDRDDADERCRKSLAKLFVNKEKFLEELYINRDPRGYALKLDVSSSTPLEMHRDFGGYYILAPDNMAWVEI